MWQRHATDAVSLVFGTIFAGVTAVWLLNVTDVIDLEEAWLFGPAILIVAGIVGLATALRPNRSASLAPSAWPPAADVPDVADVSDVADGPDVSVDDSAMRSDGSGQAAAGTPHASDESAETADTAVLDSDGSEGPIDPGAEPRT